MKKENAFDVPPSEFKGLAGIEYFDFEEDFMEQNVRCVPMIVRFKMDAAGIKLSLAEWSKFSVDERIELALKKCSNDEEAKLYNDFLAELIKKYTGNNATILKVDQHPEWAVLDAVPEYLQEKAKEINCEISTEQWRSLTDLQRFALLKLYSPGHEKKNFKKALRNTDDVESGELFKQLAILWNAKHS